MSFIDLVSPLGRAAASRRMPHGAAVAAILAAGMFCVAGSECRAASNASAEIAVTAYFAPAAPDAADGSSLMARLLECALTTANLAGTQPTVPLTVPVVGIASTYNPNDPLDRDSGDQETASGERYDAGSWTAAVRIDLRAQFGGVYPGRPGFALVQSGDKQVIVRINDVGPLQPGRVIDLNERTMRYFDPTLQAGLIDISVTPLIGQNWALGPVGGNEPVNLAELPGQEAR